MTIREISTDQLQKLGMPSVAYLKPVLVNGAMGYAIHAADGTPMAVAADRDIAIAVILDNEMHPTWVH
jgi:hypothetical protein